jgi:hypothetical protein
VTTTTGPGLGNRTVRHDTWAYPIDENSTYTPGTGNGFTVQGQATVARHLTSSQEHGNHWQPFSAVDDQVTASGVLQRDTNGATVQADGSDSELYVGVDSAGCYGHYLAADHGYVTQDVQVGCGGR